MGMGVLPAGVGGEDEVLPAPLSSPRAISGVAEVGLPLEGTEDVLLHGAGAGASRLVVLLRPGPVLEDLGVADLVHPRLHGIGAPHVDLPPPAGEGLGVGETIRFG